MPSNIKVRKKTARKNSSTDINLLVNTETDDVYFEWDRNKIVRALREEGGVGERTAKNIAKAVEQRVLSSGIQKITTSLIRELVDNELFELGYQKKLEKQASIGLPKSDIEELIFSKSQENSNIGTNNPEAIQFSLAETALKQYALQEVFSEEVAEAHRTGKVHLHDLGHPTRIYCSSHSLEYIKKYGLDLDNLDSTSAPAKHARTLSVQLNSFLASMQAYYAGALGVAYVNIMYAPYLEGMSDEQIYQEAQHLIFQASQNAFTRGGQCLFIDFNIHTGIPGYLKNIKAIGPGGKYTGKTYGEYEELALKFTHAMLKVWGKGDATGTPMAFPKCFDRDVNLFACVDGKYETMSVADLAKLYINGRNVSLPHPDNGFVDVTNVQERLCGEDGIEIILSGNVRLKSLPDHKYLVFDGEGVVEKEASDLNLNDVLLYCDFDIPASESNIKLDVFGMFKNKYPRFKICTDHGFEFIGQTKESGKIISEFGRDSNYGIDSTIMVDKNLASLLGYFVSEGSYKGNGIRIAAVKEDITSNIKEVLDNMCLSYNQKEDTFDIYNTMYGYLFRELIPQYKNHASQKNIPSVIYESNSEIKWSFIKALFDGDGTCKDNYISYCTSSVNLAHGLRILLRSVGIFSNIYEFKVRGYEATYYDVAICDKDDIRKLISRIGNRFLKFDASDSSCASRSWFSKVPTSNMTDEHAPKWIRESGEFISRARDGIKSVPEIWNKFIPLRIKHIEKCKVNAIAIEVDGDHKFVTSSGVITKNCDFHINDETFKDPKQKEVFDYACKITAKNGIVYFIFDRDEVTLSACCRLRTTISDNYMIDHPESLRFAGFQNVTINLPQCAYRAGKGNIEQFYRELESVFRICIQAHIDKKAIAAKLMSRPGMPLWQVGKIAKDGRPYIDLDKATYIIGVIGLNECLDYLIGKEIHADESTLWMGIRITSYLYFLAKEAESEFGLKFTLEESPAESASRRLAKIDQYNFKEAVVRGTGDQIYYTNSIHIRPDADVDLLTRISWQAKFHKIIESGAIIHAFVGEKMPSAKSIANIVYKAFKNTDAAQLTISPEFTICRHCGKTKIGLNDSCQGCGAFNIYGVEFGKFTGANEWNNKLLEK